MGKFCEFLTVICPLHDKGEVFSCFILFAMGYTIKCPKKNKIMHLIHLVVLYFTAG